jgi:hypothetical protein
MEGSSGPQEDDHVMTPGSEEALALWESGELSRDELARRFPDEDIVGILDAFDRMGAAAVGPTPDASVAWEAVRVKLPARLADRRRGRGKAIRLLAAATIAVLVLGATAYAVVPGVRKAMNDAAGVIAGDPDPSPRPTKRAESAETGADGSTSEGPGGEAATTDPDEGAAVEDDTQADADEHEADDDQNAGSNSGTNDDAIEDDSGSATADGSGGEGSGSEEDAGEAANGESSGPGSEETD